MKQKITFLTVLFAILATLSLSAQDKKISIQGILKDSNGAAAADNTYSVTFKLYDALTGGTSLWDETADIEVVDGIYSHLLGSETTLPENIFGTVLYLGVTVGGSELVPRTELTYSPYTLSASGVAFNGGSISFDGSGNTIMNSSNTNMDASGNMDISGSLEVGGNLEILGHVDEIRIGDSSTKIEKGGSNEILFTTNAGTIMEVDYDKINLIPNANGSTNDIDITIGDDDTGINYIADNTFSLVSDDVNVLRIDDTYRVGIRQDDPKVNLHVGSTGAIPGVASEANWTDWDSGNMDECTSCNFSHTVAQFDGDVVITGEIALVNFINYSSDRRIKKNITATNSKDDLGLLNQIAIANYDYIAPTNKSSVQTKKVIAQELKEVLPYADKLTRNVIPNVYAPSDKVTFENGNLIITTEKEHDFTAGDEVYVFSPTKDYNYSEVLEVKNPYTFVIKADKAEEKVFVYGKYVDDFHTVDYDAIAMLNVSATQELYRQIQQLQEENTALKATNNTMESRLTRLEAMMNVSTTNSQDDNRASER